MAGSDGVAATTLTIAHIPGQASAGVTAHAADTTGTSASPPGTPPTTTCTHPCTQQRPPPRTHPGRQRRGIAVRLRRVPGTRGIPAPTARAGVSSSVPFEHPRRIGRWFR